MARRIGLIQTRGIGDIIIALPIAQEFLDRGDEVHWPIDRRFFSAFQAAEPAVHFIPVDPPADDSEAAEQPYLYDMPLRLLKDLRCDTIFTLYSFRRGFAVASEALAASLKFDEYKYAIAGVPFSRKWTLRLTRNLERERALHDSLNVRQPYVCVHSEGSNIHATIQPNPQWLAGRAVVSIRPLTDNPFDWLSTLEGADHLLLLDSCFSNLVEQLNLPNPKSLVLRSPMRFTPVMKNGWTFIAPQKRR